MKKFTSLLLVFAMLICMLPSAVFADGSVQIATATDLPTVIPVGTVYELTDDIVLSEGQQIESIAGLLDGNGHTITLADKPLSDNVSGCIQNIGILSSSTLNLSGVSGSMAMTLSGTIKNSYSLVAMSSSGWDDVGGLVGTLDGGFIYNSYYAGTNSAMFADGLVGVATANGGEISNSCYTTGFSSVGMNSSKVNQTNVSKKTDMTTFDVISALNTDITSTGYIWAQDINGENGGFPVLVEDNGEVIVDKSVLEAKIAEAKLLKEEKYTLVTWSVLIGALVDAEEIFSLETATQDDVNSALSSLENAIGGLEKIKITEPVSMSDYANVKSIRTQAEIESIGSGSANTYYILENDITFDGWYMSNSTFDGVFDGNGHTITFSGGYDYGLFQKIGTNGVVQNVHFAGALSPRSDYGACAQVVQGSIVNCYTEITTDKASGLAKRLDGGVISNCYSVSKAAAGAITAKDVKSTGVFKNVYWDNSLVYPDLSDITLLGEVTALKTSAIKNIDFVNALNQNKGEFGTEWGQNSNGYPYFGENQPYTPEEEGNVDLVENKTTIAFVSERTQIESIIENQELKIDPKSAVNKIAGMFTLPDYQLNDGETVQWSIEQESVDGMATVGSMYPYLSIEKDGVLVVKATLVKVDGSTEILACTKVVISSNKIEDIKLFIAEYEDITDGTEIVDGKATVEGSEDMRILIKVRYPGELVYQSVSPDDFIISLSDPENIVKHSEGTTTFRFKEPGSAVMNITYKEDLTLSTSVELTSSYVAMERITPGISGTIVIHGRNGNSSDTSNFLPDYANVAITPSNASYADSYIITTSDENIGEYVTSMVYGYVPHKAGTVTYTAAADDNGNMISGTSVVEYVYKNPLKTVSIANNDIVINVGDNIDAGLIFEGTLTDGHEITETGMYWILSENGIISVSREGGFWKNDETAPDKGNYFLSSEYKIKGLKAGSVTVTGTPIDNTNGAQPVTFNVTVQNSSKPATDIYNIISNGIGTSALYIGREIDELEKNAGMTYGFEWYVVAMLRGGKTIEQNILNNYYQSVSDEVANWDETVKPTDVERTVLALAIMDKDITNVGGVNLAELIYNNNRLSEGSNELAYALIALDATNTEIPETSVWNRESIIDELLKFQATNGGFGLTDSEHADVDMTAICIQALAPYCSDIVVKSAVDKAVEYLKNSISDDFNYSDNVNSTAQVLLALATLKIDVTNSDNGFGGEYYNIITALDGYRNPEGNGFLYGNTVNSMATIQVMQAFDAYRKSFKDNIIYWDFDEKDNGYGDSGNDDGEDNNEDDNTGGSATQKINVYIRVADPKGTTYLKKTSYSVKKGTTVYELLKKTGLDIDVANSSNGIYIKGIEGLSEFDEGNKSGWMYSVNGKFPEASAALYKLSKGDYVEWLYTRNLGNDLGNSYKGGSAAIPKTNKEKTDSNDIKNDINEKQSFSENTFADVKKDDWHYESVKYVYDNNLMNGTGIEFEPESKMSRAMLVTVVCRLANAEKAELTHEFTDVPEGLWYSDAVAWAYANGLICGVDNTTFAPDNDISREEMALIMYRFAKMQGYDIEKKSDISDFADADDVSDWALDAIAWANNSGIVNGTGNTTLSPKTTATRAEVATILMRFCENVAK